MTEGIKFTPTQESVANGIMARYRGLLNQVRTDYEQAGWGKVDFGPISGLSINKQIEVLARDGGVNLLASCGCRAEVDNEGTFSPNYCPDHPGGPPPAQKGEKKKEPPKCADHDGLHNLVRDQKGFWVCPLYKGK